MRFFFAKSVDAVNNQVQMSVQDKPCKLILALDVPDRKAALAMLKRCGSNLKWVKIGMQLFYRHGPELLEEVAALGYRIFLDLKLHDIPNTVVSAIGSLAGHNVGLLSLHTLGGPEMMRLAQEATATHLPEAQLVGVTVLTSMDRAELAAVGFDVSPEDQVLRLARLASEAGIGGLVCSPLELRPLRESFGHEPVLVTPGIRPAGSATDDQKRIMTPAEASEVGADYIVVGRPILKADDPAKAVAGILEELALG